MQLTLFLMTALMFKHLVVDFMLQGPYMYLNKGKLLHPGGWCHAALHGASTFFILSWTTTLFTEIQSPEYAIYFAIFASLLEVQLHFLIDYSKVNICKAFGWTATTSEYFWWATGIDQFLHYLNYVLIVFLYVYAFT